MTGSDDESILSSRDSQDGNELDASKCRLFFTGCPPRMANEMASFGLFEW
jgi:hypothetical protein